MAKEGMPEEVGRVDLKLDKRFFLKERMIENGSSTRVEKSEENEKCFGGVILTNEDGLIVCKNTLDSRVELAFQQMLPIIRSNLFSWSSVKNEIYKHIIFIMSLQVADRE